MQTPEPGYCDHGKAFAARCFFCGRQGRAGRPKASTIPEHRNPAAEADLSSTVSERARRGGLERARRMRERGVVGVEHPWEALVREDLER